MTFSSKLDWGSCIISIAKTASKKIGALIRSMKFFSPEVALYLYKSTIRPCMEYCCLGWCPWLLLGIVRQTQKRICRAVGPSLAASLEHLAHCRLKEELGYEVDVLHGDKYECLLHKNVHKNLLPVVL